LILILKITIGLEKGFVVMMCYNLMQAFVMKILNVCGFLDIYYIQVSTETINTIKYIQYI